MFEHFHKANKFDPLIIGAYDNDKLCGILLGVFIHEKSGIGKLFSSRFVIYGGPLLVGNEQEQSRCLDILLKTLIHHTKNKALFIQFRNFFSQHHLLPIYQNHGFSLIDRLNYIISINSEDEMLKKMSESRSRQIHKAVNNGVSIIEPENIEQVRDFYKILFNLYRYKIRKPLPDWSFFENFYNITSKIPGTRNLDPGTPIGIIRLVRYNGNIIGGILAPVFEDKCIYEWYVCGLDQKYKNQYPSVMATWAGIEYAIENNIKSFDFMGVGKPNVEYGVRDFKARFGGELVNHGRITRINNRFLYSIAEFGYNILALLRKI